MGIGIYNKLKKAMKSIGQRIAGFAKKAVASLPKIADVGHKVIGAVSPILSTTFPGTAPILNTIDKGLNYVSKFASKGFGNESRDANASFANMRGKGNVLNGIGKSLIPELDWLNKNKNNVNLIFTHECHINVWTYEDKL